MPLVLHNAVAMLVARLAPPGFSFAINVAMARLFGADGLGSYVYLMSLLVVFQALAGAGMPLYLTRELVVRPGSTPELLRKAKVVGCLAGALVAIGLVGFAGLTEGRDELASAAALALGLAVSPWIAAQEAYFVARHEHHAVAAIAIAENAFKLALAAACLAMGRGLTAVCLVISLSRLVAIGVGLGAMRRGDVPHGWRLAPGELGAFVRELRPFGALIALAVVFGRIDVIIVGAMGGSASAGFYGAAVALYSVALLIPEGAMAAVYPRFASAFHTGEREARDTPLLVAKVLALGLVPLSLAWIDLAEPILRIVYGEPFVASAPALRVLAASLPVHAVHCALGQALQAAGHQRALVGGMAASAGVHVALTLALVALLGWPGASLAVLLSSAALALVSARLFHVHVGRIRAGLGTWIGASAIAAPGALAVFSPPGLEVVATATGLAWLVLALLARRVFRPAEVAEMVRLVRSVRMEVRA